jgi:hypothetical protein
VLLQFVVFLADEDFVVHAWVGGRVPLPVDIKLNSRKGVAYLQWEFERAGK